MEVNVKEQQKRFNEEIAELLKTSEKNQLILPQRLDVLHLDELPDLSKWRKSE